MNKKIKIALDAGHGGSDPGAISVNGTKEKDITLAITLLVDEFLRQAGVDTYLTRKTDTYVSLSDRTNGININKCDYAVSIHVDSTTRSTAEHFGVYVIKFGGEAEKLAKSVINEIVSAIGWNWGADDDGIREKNLHIIRETKMPAILIECNFISNPKIEQQLLNKEFQIKLARTIANGILKYLGIDNVISDWKKKIIEDATKAGLISEEHNPDDVASKWFVLVVALNILKMLKR